MKKVGISTYPDTIERPVFGVSQENPISLFIVQWAETQLCRHDMHYGLEIGILLEGKMRRYFGDQKFTLKRGDVWFCGMWEPHGYDVASAPSRAIVMIVFPPILAQSHFSGDAPIRWLAPFETPPEARPVTRQQNRGRILQLAEALEAIKTADGKHAGLMLRLKLLELLLVLQENWEAPPSATTSTQMDVSRAHQALRLITSSRRRVSLQEAAQVCGLHRNTLGRQFENLMGISFSEFGLRYRIAAAAEQLVQSGDSVKKVAADWGFSNPSHLHRCFRKHYGCSPSQYVANFKKG
jgi:AraC-like DNA-binding protein